MTLFPSWHFPPQLPPTHHPTHPLRPSLSPFLPPCPYWTFDSLKRGEQVGSKGCGLLPPSFSPLFPLMRPLIERLPGSRRESAAHSSTNRLGLPRAGPSAPPPPSISLEGGGGGGGDAAYCPYGPAALAATRRRSENSEKKRAAGAQRTQRAFLLYADNTVYQICTPTVKRHGPDKGTISVAAVQGLAHRFRGHATYLFTGQSETFRVPMPGSWQVTRRKNVNFCHNCV